ncbi:MAG: hypothetical protein ACOY3L_10155 [Pseudomonadota bacterium]
MLLALAIAGCATAKPAPAVTGCSGDEQYIPRGTFPRDYPGSDEARRGWYSLSLLRMGEPSLACGDWQGAEAYRILWLNALWHPVAIRVGRRGSEIELVATQLSGIASADPGVILAQVRKTLPVSQWYRLTDAVRHSEFWSLPTSGNMYGLHGEQWVVEGRRGDAYHIVDRWSPGAGAYRDLGVLFFDLAGWQRPASAQ